jgi:tetratricopeptide (TPR) repeat protein
MHLMFEANTPTLRPGFGSETELWDFKSDCPQLAREYANAWADVAKEILAFHNRLGGILIFGLRDDYSFCGATTRLDGKLVNDQLRRYLRDTIWVDFNREFIQPDQRYLGIAVIPPRGPRIERFLTDAPVVNGSRLFGAGDSAIREGDSSRILRRAEADRLARAQAVPTLGKVFAVDESFFRILQPDYIQFVERSGPCQEIERALRDPRASIASVVGIGGVGKTALATWAALRAYERKDFEFIVAMTAKDRELTSSGIQALEPPLTSYEALLDGVLEVLQFPETKSEPFDVKERKSRELLEDTKGLLYIDNLETVDDARIIRFLDNLPVGARALVTSRRTRVRVSVHPIDLGTLTDDEALAYIESLATQPGSNFAAELATADRVRIARACGGIPLAIRWTLSCSKSPSEAVALADKITSLNSEAEQLLEFCFRRVFDSMPGSERSVLEVLSLFQSPIPAEALLVGAKLPDYKLLDVTEGLLADALLQRLWDPDRNDYSYTLLPVTRAFVYAQVARQTSREQEIRKTLSDWFNARDIREAGERVIISEMRQGKGASESPLLDLASAAERRGDHERACELYRQAVARNPKSWRAARLFAEFYRHQLRNQAEALRLYEQAAANAPRRGPDRTLIFREWGMLLRDSGYPNATDLAIEKLEIAHAEDPRDVVATHALAHMLGKRGVYRRVIELLEPLASSRSEATRQKTLPLLLEAYDQSGEMVKAASLRPIVRKLNGGP